MRRKLGIAFVSVALVAGISNYMIVALFSNSAVSTGVALAIADALIGILAGTSLSRYFTHHLKNLTMVASLMSKGDLTRKVEIHTGDEIEELASSFNAMVGSLSNIVNEVKISTAQIVDTAQLLSANTVEMKESTQGISATVQGIARGADFQAEMVNRTTQITHDVARSTEAISEKAKTAVSLAREASLRARQGADDAAAAIEKISQISQTVERASGTVAGFRKQALQINKTVDSISSIAQQTHLLALNATIEAARAGEHGRGFAVIAEEISKLADNARGFAEQIADLAKGINHGSSDVIESMKDSLTSAVEGRSVVDEVNKHLEGIKNAVQSTVEHGLEISAATESQSQGAEHLVKAIEEIAQIAQNNASGTREASAATHEQTSSMREIFVSAQRIKKTADTLNEIVTIFRV